MIVKNSLFVCDAKTGEIKLIDMPDANDLSLTRVERWEKLRELMKGCNLEWRPLAPCGEAPTKRILEGVKVKAALGDGTFDMTWESEHEEPMTEADWEQIENWNVLVND